MEAEHEGRSGAGTKIEDERPASSATAMLYIKVHKYKNTYIYRLREKMKKRCVYRINK